MNEREWHRGGAVRLTVAAIVLGASVLAGCSKDKQAGPRVVPVLVAQAEKRAVPLQIKAIGNVEASNSVVVRSQVNGEISEVFFREGQDVRAGTMLFRIDPRPFEAALRQAESALARDRAQAKNAAEEAKRYEQLSAKGFVSRQEHDRARTGADALAAVVQVDEAAVENARLQLEYTAIMSPLNGRTGAILVQKGNVVKANETMLVTINQLSPLFVTFSVPEQDLAAIRKHKAAGGLHVEAVTAPGTRPIDGTLTFFDNKVNASTGTILLKASFPNLDHALWPGQFVDVILTLATEQDRVVVPSAAVQTGQQGQFVFAVKEDSTAEVRPVAVARTFENWSVIDKGVQAGETVVTDGQIRLAPGVKVEIKNAEKGTATSTEKK